MTTESYNRFKAWQKRQHRIEWTAKLIGGAVLVLLIFIVAGGCR